jgi:tetratricopeptide (TPR) repeat protein
MKRLHLLCLLVGALCWGALSAQTISQPASGGNYEKSISHRIGVTTVAIRWNAPGVKGREGKIWGTPVAHYGFQNLGFGSSQAAPWRAGANENTTIHFSTDVLVQGKPLAAGTYGFFIALYPDSCTLIFSKNNNAWGSFFYDPTADALRLNLRQQKNMPSAREWLQYDIGNPTPNSAEISMEWERWRIAFNVSVDVQKTTVDAMRRDLTSNIGFADENWITAANFCLTENYNLEEGLAWAGQAMNFNPNFFNANIKAQLEEKLGKKAEAEKTIAAALEHATVSEIHQYGRQLVGKKEPAKAMEIFLLNHKKHGDAWPVHVGLMRGYSATGDLKKALEHGKKALAQAPDDLNRSNLENLLKVLSEGKALTQ